MKNEKGVSGHLYILLAFWFITQCLFILVEKKLGAERLNPLWKSPGYPTPRYYGVGGGLRSNESRECVFPFRLEGQDNCWYKSCISFNDLQPWNATGHNPDSFEHYSVDLRRWCPVSSHVYNIDGTNRSQWGFCSVFSNTNYHSNITLSPTTTDSGSNKNGIKLYFPFLLFILPAVYYMIGGMKKI